MLKFKFKLNNSLNNYEYEKELFAQNEILIGPIWKFEKFILNSNLDNCYSEKKINIIMAELEDQLLGFLFRNERKFRSTVDNTTLDEDSELIVEVIVDFSEKENETKNAKVNIIHF